MLDILLTLRSKYSKLGIVPKPGGNSVMELFDSVSRWSDCIRLNKAGNWDSLLQYNDNISNLFNLWISVVISEM